MDATSQTPAPRRHVWRWVLLGAGLCLTPFVLLAVVAVSYVTLDRDVRVLRNHVMDATDAGWNTKVQMSVGRLTLGAIGQGLRFVDHKDMDDARLALRSVKHASVGVYERRSGGKDWSREQLFSKTDRAMQERGWTRMVGVADKKDTVLIYVQDDADDDEPIELCLAVVNSKEMVVVSTSVDAATLGELVARHTGDDVKHHLRSAKFRF
ncbi:MAG TPA: hypothetical protein VGD97_05805 [Lacunisphaera sp.]